MKSVLIFSAYIPPHLGGIERYIDNLSKEFVKKNIKTVIVTTNYNNDKKYEKINNIDIYRLPIFNIFKNRYPIPKNNKVFKHILKELNNYNFDAILVNTRFHLTSHIGAKYGKENNIPVYLIEHGSQYVTLNNKFIDFFANRYEDFLTFKIKDKITGFYGVSEACGKWLENFNIDYSGTWYNSIDLSQKVPNKKKTKNINFLYAGRIIKQKGVENILDSFTKLNGEYKNINLFIAGDGPELSDYKNRYKNKNIKFLGKLDFNELLKYYAKTDIFLYPPLWPEGLPTSILEAGMMRCSVIVTDQGGIKEIIKNNKNGIIVGNTKESLYKGMKKLLDSEKLRQKYADELRKIIENKFAWDVTAEKIVKDIEKELKNN